MRRHYVRTSSSLLSFRLLVLGQSVTVTFASRPFFVGVPILLNKDAAGCRLPFHLRGGSQSHLATNIHTYATDNNMSANLWNGEDTEAFASLEHDGYSMESDPVTHVGGWVPHRTVWQPVSGATCPCWIKDQVMDKISKYDYSNMPIGRGPRILVLYGSLRSTSFSRKLAYEFARLLELLGCDVRVYNPTGLPVRDPNLETHLKVLELRALAHWSEGTNNEFRSRI
jgi:hypothetical protein